MKDAVLCLIYASLIFSTGIPQFCNTRVKKRGHYTFVLKKQIKPKTNNKLKGGWVSGLSG